MNAITSKEFNSKKAAQAAARKVYGADYADKVSIDTLDEKWYVSEIVEEPVEETVAETTGEPAASAERFKFFVRTKYAAFSLIRFVKENGRYHAIIDNRVYV